MYNPNDPNAYLREMVRKAEKEAERASNMADFMLVMFFLLVLTSIPLALIFGR